MLRAVTALLFVFLMLLMGGRVTADQTKTVQTQSVRARPSEPTFTKDIAPIVFAKCAGCHRPNQVGPFPLLTYADVKKRARLIAQVVSQRIMPPWKPVPGHGE